MRQGMRWGWKGLIANIVIGVGIYAASPCLAQEHSTVPRSYVNKASANIPVFLDDRARPLLKEVQLYAKESLQAAWTLKDKVPPTQRDFHFKAPHDGEFFFCVVTVDKQGRSVPADLNAEPPGLVIVFDTKAPTVEVQTLTASAEGQEVRCEIRDANPDASKTRFSFQTRDKIWRPLEPVQGQLDLFCIPAQAACSGMVRVSAADMAGNTVTKDFQIAIQQPVQQLVQQTSAPTPAPNASGQQKVVQADVRNVDKGPVFPMPEMDKPAKTNDKTSDGSFAERVEVVVQKSTVPTKTGPEMTPTAEKGATPEATEVKPQVLGKRQIVNTTHVFLDYQIDETGASGVGRVEIWYTRDMGKSWQKLTEDSKRKSPAEVELPSEGLFGISMVVCNGRGFSTNPPAAGDAPDMWIEVDTTRPTAELTGAKVVEDGSFVITWRAFDKNIADEPVDLFFAANREGPWRPIGKGLKNDGTYRWAPGQEAGTQAFLRLVVHDLAGNVAVSETVQPVVLDDLSRPRGRLLGISTTPRSNLAPTGN
ncbi:MAG: hypothetical protein HY040_18560 [Planctomycetes bacterium]|nr:hypothetical protein [Planctomycetota bacterium]